MANDLGAKRFIAVNLGPFADTQADGISKAMRIHPCRVLGQFQAFSSARTVNLTVGLKLYQPLTMRDRSVKIPNRSEMILAATKVLF
ncbi:MAG: hypothetical protein EOP07_22415 [Proteobacteria bacterium]|nr:MAG: hypothetical protein EOP07_22415 [Pseudomonadota bacterium]